jgi:ABC-type transport system substrate-binding protein
MSAAGGTAAMMAAIANAIKASGVVVNVTPEDFAAILRRIERPLIVSSEGGFFSTSYKYLTSYKGLAFYTKARVPLVLPSDAEIVRAKGISIPQL